MNNDLISRKELLKQFTITPEGRKIPEYDVDSFPVTVDISDVKDAIRKAPTVVDPEKLIEDMKTMIANFDCSMCTLQTSTVLCDDECDTQLIESLVKLVEGRLVPNEEA